MVELVPASWTRQDIRDDARTIMKQIGQVPVSLSREVPGFVLNRMQYALLNECFRLILDGVVSAEDLDVVMKDGLGLRYAFLGPMETIHLNAHGLRKYCETYGETIYNVSSDMAAIPEAWLMRNDEEKAKIEKIHQQMLELIPLEEHGERCLKRDRSLAALAKLKRQLQNEDK
jgi:L-gulonate 3-dehydrogenase